MNFKMMVTHEGKHPSSKWAMLAAEDIIDISAQAESTKIQEANAFRDKMIDLLSHHVQVMMNHEQDGIAAGKHSLDLPYETEPYAKQVVREIVDLAKGTSFADHFKQDFVQSHLQAVCNSTFKSAKLVERQQYHDEHAAKTAKTIK